MNIICVSSIGASLTFGKIYKVLWEDEKEYLVINDNGDECYYPKCRFLVVVENKGQKITQSKQEAVVSAVLYERQRQDAKWGEQNHYPHFWTGILGEEYGEFCEAVNETVFDNGSDKGGYENMKKEAIHVAAVAIGFLECLERNKGIWKL